MSIKDFLHILTINGTLNTVVKTMLPTAALLAGVNIPKNINSKHDTTTSTCAIQNTNNAHDTNNAHASNNSTTEKSIHVLCQPDTHTAADSRKSWAGKNAQFRHKEPYNFYFVQARPKQYRQEKNLSPLYEIDHYDKQASEQIAKEQEQPNLSTTNAQIKNQQKTPLRHTSDATPDSHYNDYYQQSPHDDDYPSHNNSNRSHNNMPPSHNAYSPNNYTSTPQHTSSAGSKPNLTTSSPADDHSNHASGNSSHGGHTHQKSKDDDTHEKSEKNKNSKKGESHDQQADNYGHQLKKFKAAQQAARNADMPVEANPHNINQFDPNNMSPEEQKQFQEFLNQTQGQNKTLAQQKPGLFARFLQNPVVRTIGGLAGGYAANKVLGNAWEWALGGMKNFFFGAPAQPATNDPAAQAQAQANQQAAAQQAEQATRENDEALEALKQEVARRRAGAARAGAHRDQPNNAAHAAAPAAKPAHVDQPAQKQNNEARQANAEPAAPAHREPEQHNSAAPAEPKHAHPAQPNNAAPADTPAAPINNAMPAAAPAEPVHVNQPAQNQNNRAEQANAEPAAPAHTQPAAANTAPAQAHAAGKMPAQPNQQDAGPSGNTTPGMSDKARGKMPAQPNQQDAGPSGDTTPDISDEERDNEPMRAMQLQEQTYDELKNQYIDRTIDKYIKLLEKETKSMPDLEKLSAWKLSGIPKLFHEKLDLAINELGKIHQDYQSTFDDKDDILNELVPLIRGGMIEVKKVLPNNAFGGLWGFATNWGDPQALKKQIERQIKEATAGYFEQLKPLFERLNQRYENYNGNHKKNIDKFRKSVSEFFGQDENEPAAAAPKK